MILLIHRIEMSIISHANSKIRIYIMLNNSISFALKEILISVKITFLVWSLHSVSS